MMGDIKQNIFETRELRKPNSHKKKHAMAGGIRQNVSKTCELKNPTYIRRNPSR